MNNKKNRKSSKQELIDLLKNRIKALRVEKQLYEQNPTLMRNIKMVNIELIQNDIETLTKTLSKILTESVPGGD